MADFDLAVVGGGINGTGIARDAAGRGLSVLLCEQHDLICAPINTYHEVVELEQLRPLRGAQRRPGRSALKAGSRCG